MFFVGSSFAAWLSKRSHLVLQDCRKYSPQRWNGTQPSAWDVSTPSQSLFSVFQLVSGVVVEGTHGAISEEHNVMGEYSGLLIHFYQKQRKGWKLFFILLQIVNKELMKQGPGVSVTEFGWKMTGLLLFLKNASAAWIMRRLRKNCSGLGHQDARFQKSLTLKHPCTSSEERNPVFMINQYFANSNVAYVDRSKVSRKNIEDIVFSTMFILPASSNRTVQSFLNASCSSADRALCLYRSLCITQLWYRCFEPCWVWLSELMKWACRQSKTRIACAVDPLPNQRHHLLLIFWESRVNDGHRVWPCNSRLPETTLRWRYGQQSRIWDRRGWLSRKRTLPSCIASILNVGCRATRPAPGSECHRYCAEGYSDPQFLQS